MKIRLAAMAGVLLVAGAGSVAALFAEDKPQSPGSFYGKIYADWYYDVGDTAPAHAPITKHSEFEVTRAYLGYKYRINDHFSTDALLDIERAGPAKSASASFDSINNSVSLSLTKDDRYFAYLKLACFSWKDIVPHTTLTLGQLGYITFNVQEGFWGHRYLYKSFMDAQGWEPSADMGATVGVSPNDMFKITAAVVNGDGYKASQDSYGDYKIGSGVQVNPVKDLTIYLYGDWMPVGSTTDTAQSTVALFAGYKIIDKGKIGVEYNMQMKQKGVTDHDVGGFSIYGMYNITKPLEVFLRYDMASSKDDWNTAKDGSAIVAGLQYSPVSKVKIALDFQHSQLKLSGAKSSDRIYFNGEFDY